MNFEHHETAAVLRHAFDRSFAEIPRGEADLTQSFLAIRIGGEPYAVRLSEVAGLHTDRKIVTLPSHDPDLLGLVGFRGGMAPVYDLRTLFGYPGGPPPRWLLVLRVPDLIGLAFDRFETHIRARTEDVSAEDRGAFSRYVSGIVQNNDDVLPLIHMASLIAEITSRSQQDTSPKE